MLLVDKAIKYDKAGSLARSVISILLIAAGLFGCYRMTEMVGGIVLPAKLSEFILKHVPAPAISDDVFLTEAVLKAYSGEYDTYIYQQGGRLIWLIGYDIEPTTEIIYHIYTNEPKILPENRVQYGFDNRGFRPDGENELEEMGSYRVFEKEIPTEYNVTYIKVGFNPGGGLVWSSSFKPS